MSGALAVVTVLPTADAAPADLLPPASGILPGPAAGGDDPGSWGPCVPDPDATDNCQGWLIPPGQIVTSFPGTDDGPSVVVGGDFTADLGSAETEGLLVVNGDALFNKSYNVGVAGGGTGVVPAHRADMLVVGGDGTVVNPSLDPQAGGGPATVGIGLTTTDGTSRFGDIHVGGTWNFRDPSYTEASNPGFGRLGDIDSANQSPPAVEQQNVIDHDTSVLEDDHYTDLFGADGKMARYSQQCYAELSTDTTATTVTNEGGTLTLEHGTVTESGSDVTLTSDGTGQLVEFSLPPTLGARGTPVNLHFVGVADGATVLVNTLSTGTVSQFIGDVYWGSGTSDDLKARALTIGNHILWNYPFTTDLTLGGATQFPGSILVGETTSTTSVGFSGTNGRIYTPGDLVHSGAATSTSGDELHTYPFTGALGCLRAVPGTFSVQKAITGEGASTVPDDTAFTAHWEVTGPSDSPDLGRSGDLTFLADGTPVAGPTDLQEGDEVTISEVTPPDVPGVDWSTPTFSPNPVTIGGENTVQAVTVTNTATLQRGGFTIDKTVAGDSGASTTTFDIGWQCSAENLDGDDSGTVHLTGGGSETITGFPVGTTCTFTEPAPDDDHGTWASAVDPTSLVIEEGDGTSQVVTVMNTFTHAVGGFTIRKTVTGDPGASTTTFTGTWTCDAPNADGRSSGTWSLSDGGRLGLDGFPTGTTCSVAEDTPTDDNGTWTSSIDPSGPFTITEGDASARVVTVTNTFTHAVGGFSIVKTVTGDDGASTTTFTGRWTCDAADAQGDSSGTWSLEDGGTVAFDGFPTGTTCSVTEDRPTDDNGTWSSSIEPEGDFVITEGTSATQVVRVTNTFTSTVGGFQVSKLVRGDDGASVDTFTIDWSCDQPNADGRSSGSVTLHAGDESDPITGFPVGTTCTITEPAVDDPSGTWAATITPATVTIGSEGTSEIAAVTVTNTFTASRGGFTIQKEVTGDPGASTTSFAIDWRCSAANADGDDSGTVRLTDGDTATITGFPVGTTCRVTEDTPSDDNGTWRTPTIDPGEVTIAEDDGTTQVVTVTNTFDAPTPTPTPTPTPSGTTPAPTSPAPSTTTPAPAPTSGPTTPSAGGGGLAVTGFDALTIAAVGAFLLALGLAAVLVARRRRS
ncbi:DUF5979 domain-containing protein [Luteimicrobium xylanilyticum]|uniref:DUF5979 domain-containing protein n=1 Tax=Luteimicrobium xylanilyticum TaxID=1133546 RepID=UPI0004BA5928|nr:DUF5979 domain-containing protein [Luteimicrobium xylanilyticum]